MNDSLSQASLVPPETSFSQGKTLIEKCNILLNNKSYIKRIYDDGSAELIRYDEEQHKWACLCFRASDEQDKSLQIREAVRNNFDLNK